MTAHGSPTQVQPGFIVRIRLDHNQMYSSKRMHLSDAHTVARNVRELFRKNFNGFVVVEGFPSPEIEELSVRVSFVTAVEVRSVNADRSLIPAVEAVPLCNYAACPESGSHRIGSGHCIISAAEQVPA